MPLLQYGFLFWLIKGGGCLYDVDRVCPHVKTPLSDEDKKRGLSNLKGFSRTRDEQTFQMFGSVGLQKFWEKVWFGLN